MTRLTLATLGGLEIGGAAAAGPSLPRKAQGMLVYLALNGTQPVSREKLAALFWGDSPDAQARTNLRAVAGGTELSGQRIETQQRAVGFVGQQVEPSVRALAHVADARLQAFEQALLVHDLFAVEFGPHQHLAG